MTLKGLLCDQTSISSPLYIPNERSDAIMLKKDWVYRRGDIYYADLQPVVGSEQVGIRPVVILQNNVGNRHSPTVIAAPITSRLGKPRLPNHVTLDGSADRLH